MIMICFISIKLYTLVNYCHSIVDEDRKINRKKDRKIDRQKDR